MTDNVYHRNANVHISTNNSEQSLSNKDIKWICLNKSFVSFTESNG